MLQRSVPHYPLSVSELSVPSAVKHPSMTPRQLDALIYRIPPGLRRWLRVQQRRFRLQRVRVGTVDFGSLHRLTPISRVFGLDRGLPIDRYYIEQFLAANAADIQGRVLEFGDNVYTRKFGGSRVTQSDVLNVVPSNQATLIADLTHADNIASNLLDCIICTQTLQMIYDLRAALHHLHRILKPGGVLLATCSGITKLARREGIDPWGEYWHLTAQSAAPLFQEFFSCENIQVNAYGNVLTAAASLYGLAAEELTRPELDYHDPDYEVLITIRAWKSR